MVRGVDPLRIHKDRGAKFWMLLIGVNKYSDPGLTDLGCAENDCQELATSLDKITSSFAVKQQFIYQGQDSSHDRIQASLEQIRAEAEKDDIVLIYFAGHGYVSKQSTYLCLAETTLDNLSEHNGISLSSLFKTLKNCSAKKQLVLIDACHSGDSGTLNPRGSQSFYPGGHEVVIARSADATRQGLAEGIIGEVDQYKNTTTASGLRFFSLLSCDQHQESYEDSKLGHGIFTYFLIRGLQGDAVDQQSGEIRPLQLFSHVTRETEKYARQHGKDQTPRTIANGTEFEIGKFLDDGSSQNNPEKRKEEFTLIYRKVRRQRHLTEEDKHRLEQERKRLNIREKLAEEIIDDWNHRFEQCENKIKAYITSKNLPVREEVCNLALLNEIRQENLSSEDIEPVWKRIVAKISEQFEAWKQQLLALLQEHGSTYKFSLENRPTDLTEINVKNTAQSLCADFTKREAAYCQALAACVAEYWHEIDVNAYPEELEAKRQVLLKANGLPNGKLYITSLEQKEITAHHVKLQQFKAKTKPIITQHLLPLPEDVRQTVTNRGEKIGLKPTVIAALTDELCSAHRQTLESCQPKIAAIISDRYPEELTEDDRQRVRTIMADHEIPNLTDPLLNVVLEDYTRRVTRYEDRVMRDLHQYHPFDPFVHEWGWPALATELQLSKHTTNFVEAECKERFNNKKTDCEQKAQAIIQKKGRSLLVDQLLAQLKTDSVVDDLSLVLLQAICSDQIEIYADRCNSYEQEYNSYARICYPLTSEALSQLTTIKSMLCSDDSQAIEATTNQDQEQKITRYHEQLPKLIHKVRPYPEDQVGDELAPRFRALQESMGVGAATVRQFDEQAIVEYRQALANYRKTVEYWLDRERKSLQDPDVMAALEAQQGFLHNEVAIRIQEEVDHNVQQRRQQQKRDWWTELTK